MYYLLLLILYYVCSANALCYVVIHTQYYYEISLEAKCWSLNHVGGFRRVRNLLFAWIWVLGFHFSDCFWLEQVQSFVIFGFDSTLVWTHCFNFSSKYEVLNNQGRPDEASRPGIQGIQGFEASRFSIIVAPRLKIRQCLCTDQMDALVHNQISIC